MDGVECFAQVLGKEDEVVVAAVLKVMEDPGVQVCCIALGQASTEFWWCPLVCPSGQLLNQCGCS